MLENLSEAYVKTHEVSLVVLGLFVPFVLVKGILNVTAYKDSPRQSYDSKFVATVCRRSSYGCYVMVLRCSYAFVHTYPHTLV